jgi:hypothetical protein
MVAKLEQSTADALQQLLAELEEHVRTQPANVDETSWREAMQKAWLWVVVTPLVTVFRIAATRCAKAAGELLGSACWQVVTWDRWKAYNRFRRQLCWSHLRRDSPGDLPTARAWPHGVSGGMPPGSPGGQAGALPAPWDILHAQGCLDTRHYGVGVCEAVGTDSRRLAMPQVLLVLFRSLLFILKGLDQS